MAKTNQNQIEISSKTKQNLTQNWIHTHTKKNSMKFLDRGPSIGKIINAFFFFLFSLTHHTMTRTFQQNSILNSDCVKSSCFFQLYCAVFSFLFFYFWICGRMLKTNPLTECLESIEISSILAKILLSF